MMHSVERTSPKGGPFVGTCTPCGKQGLTMKTAREECPNPRDVAMDDVLLDALFGPKKDIVQ